MRHLLYGIQYVWRHRILKDQVPLICGLVLTNRCNLRCRHCRLVDRKPADLSFENVTVAIETFYTQGGRCLYLHGGEPFLWSDGQAGIEQAVEYAHRIGFLTVVIYTNGTRPIQTSANTVFVSLDGLRQTHDSLRGRSFDRIVENIDNSPHPSIYVNFTINNRNKHEIEAFCAFVDARPRIQGVFFYLHTPYYGVDELYLEPAEKQQILRNLLVYRRKYRVLNSRAGLKSALRNDWKRPLGICSVFEGGRIYECCRYNTDPELCRNCGYLSYAEIDQTLKLRPSAMLNALKYF